MARNHGVPRQPRHACRQDRKKGRAAQVRVLTSAALETFSGGEGLGNEEMMEVVRAVRVHRRLENQASHEGDHEGNDQRDDCTSASRQSHDLLAPALKKVAPSLA
jgi:hypothetical protein